MSSGAALDPYLQTLARTERPPPDAPAREVEAWALTTAAQRMRAAASHPDRMQLRDALLLNQRLWTIFQADLMAEECPLPAETRRTLLELSMFVDGETLERLSDLDGGRIGILADVNIALAGGLREGADEALAVSRQRTHEGGKTGRAGDGSAVKVTV